jgi:hypothetical protein
MTADKLIEPLTGVKSMVQVRPEHPFDDEGNLVGRQVPKHFPADVLLRPIPATHEQVVSFDHVISDGYFRGE